MARPLLQLLGVLHFLSFACAKLVEHTFNVETIATRRLCKMQEINTVNGRFPGPTIYAEEGDTIVVHVINKSPYNITIHWHGILQFMSCWADGPAYITQCPIFPGKNYTYKFNIIGQEGTLWWHAHDGYQRATVHGALIIYPRKHPIYPFPKPHEEIPIILGEWWNQNVVNLEKQMFESGRGHDLPDANIINGYPGDLYSCSSSFEGRMLDVLQEQQKLLKLPSHKEKTQPGTFQMKVIRGKTYLLRIINAGLNSLLFFKIANHNMIVVAVDALYTNPYFTDLIVIAPGQTTDVLFTADQPHDSYYMATTVYRTAQGDRLNNISGTGIIVYGDDEESIDGTVQLTGTKSQVDHTHRDKIGDMMSKKNPEIPNIPDYAILQLTQTKSQHEGQTYENQPSNSLAKTKPKMPDMPDFHDTQATHEFYGSLTSLVGWRFWSPVPDPVDDQMFITTGLSLVHCEEKHICTGPLDQRMAGSLNNISFSPPSQLSILEAHYYNKANGIYTTDFPDKPTHEFDYTNEENHRLDETLVFTQKGTKVKKIRYNSTVEIVFQTTGLVAAENHPMHLHGYNFYVLGQGFGNYDPIKDRKNLNFVNPQIRNTFDVPIKGWAVIRFRANNPGAWYMHCHIEAHLPIGLAVVLIVEDGPTPSTKLPPPPPDLPRC